MGILLYDGTNYIIIFHYKFGGHRDGQVGKGAWKAANPHPQAMIHHQILEMQWHINKHIIKRVYFDFWLHDFDTRHLFKQVCFM